MAFSPPSHYQTQPTGYKAFTPQNLPPYPALVIGENLKKLLVLTEQKLAELNGIGFSLPNPDLFIVMAIRKEALLSSQIEGTKATMTDILTYETWAVVDNLDDVQEVVNYIKALHHGIARLDKLSLCIGSLKNAMKFF